VVDILEESAMTLRMMSLKEFIEVEQRLGVEDPLNVSVKTDITEIVDLLGSGAIRQEENARFEWA
jgi:hypothetical protein